jgi:predicted SAM-dependent methyltransferase
MRRLPLKKTADGQIFLNLGCGGRSHAEWNNLDFVAAGPAVVQHDILSGLPYEAERIDAVYSAHFIEHLSPQEARAVLAESFRVLKKKGVLRVLLPDTEYNARLYVECLQTARSLHTPEAHEHYEWARLNLFEQMVRERPGGALAEFLTRSHHHDPDFIRSSIAGPDYDLFQRSLENLGPVRQTLWRRAKIMARRTLAPIMRTRVVATYFAGLFRSSGELHKWAYDSLSLTELLHAIGYVDVKSVSVRESAIPTFARYFLDVDPSGAVYKPNSLVFEAHRP